jgi:hypothetical protein
MRTLLGQKIGGGREIFHIIIGLIAGCFHAEAGMGANKRALENGDQKVLWKRITIREY